MNSRVLRRLLLGGSVAVVIVGVVVLAVAASQPLSFGWFASSPLSGTTFTPGDVHIISTATSTGLTILVVGVIGLAFLTGWSVGRRSLPLPSDDPPLN